LPSFALAGEMLGILSTGISKSIDTISVTNTWKTLKTPSNMAYPTL